MNKERLEKFKKTAMTTLQILNAIEKGHRSGTLIANKTGASRQLCEYYLKALGAK